MVVYFYLFLLLFNMLHYCMSHVIKVINNNHHNKKIYTMMIRCALYVYMNPEQIQKLTINIYSKQTPEQIPNICKDTHTHTHSPTTLCVPALHC